MFHSYKNTLIIKFNLKRIYLHLRMRNFACKIISIEIFGIKNKYLNSKIANITNMIHLAAICFLQGKHENYVMIAYMIHFIPINLFLHSYLQAFTNCILELSMLIFQECYVQLCNWFASIIQNAPAIQVFQNR